MPVKTKTITISSKADLDIIDITAMIQDEIQESYIQNGIVTIFVPGSTASISTMEFEPNLVRDVKKAIERMIPSTIDYEHHKTWGDDNGKSHVRATFMGPGITVPFTNHKLLVGTWQQIVVLDFDTRARRREIVVQIMGE